MEAEDLVAIRALVEEAAVRFSSSQRDGANAMELLDDLRVQLEELLRQGHGSGVDGGVGGAGGNNLTNIHVASTGENQLTVTVDYVQVGGWTLGGSSLALSKSSTVGSKTTIVAARLDCTAPITSGTTVTLVAYASMAALQSAQDDLSYFIRPLVEIRESVAQANGTTSHAFTWSIYALPDVGVFEGVVQSGGVS